MRGLMTGSSIGIGIGGSSLIIWALESFNQGTATILSIAAMLLGLVIILVGMLVWNLSGRLSSDEK